MYFSTSNVIIVVSGLSFRSTQNNVTGVPKALKDTNLRLYIMCLKQLKYYPQMLDANTLFTEENRIADYVTSFHMIKSSYISEGAFVNIGLVNENGTSHIAIWKIPLGSIVYGQSTHESATKGVGNTDTIFTVKFKNLSARIRRYSVLFSAYVIRNAAPGVYNATLKLGDKPITILQNTEIKGEKLLLKIPNASRYYLDDLLDTKVSFSNGTTLRNEANCRRICDQPCCDTMQLQLDNVLATPTAVEVIVEIKPEVTWMGCSLSLQRVFGNSIQPITTLPSDSQSVVGIVEQSSIALPCFPMRLVLQAENILFMSGDRVVYSLCRNAIESITVKKETLSSTMICGDLKMYVNHVSVPYSHYLHMKVYCGNVPTVLEYFRQSKRMDSGIKDKRYKGTVVSSTGEATSWVSLLEMSSNTTSESPFFLNTETGRCITSIPKLGEVYIRVERKKSLEAIQFAYTNVGVKGLKGRYENAIVVTRVDSKDYRCMVGVGYVLQIIQCAGESLKTVSKMKIEEVTRLLQNEAKYPIILCLNNPFLVN